MARPKRLEKTEKPWCMFCGAHVGEVSEAVCVRCDNIIKQIS